MRNILVHEYFGVSPSIIWSTIKKDLPGLKEALVRSLKRYENTTHPWRICPPGEIYVRQTEVRQHLRKGADVREHLRREHCRELGDSVKDVLTFQETQDIPVLFFKEEMHGPSSHDLDFGSKGLEFDPLIGGWTRYWNEVFHAEPPLDPNIVKALIASESSFDVGSGKKKRNKAKGLMQLMPNTIRYLNGERKELRDQIFRFQGTEVYDASLNICAGIRWLFRKRETASSRLGRTATWEETVEEYKDYLRRRLKNPKLPLKGMKFFREYLQQLQTKQ